MEITYKIDIESWIEGALKSVRENDLTEDLHIDELINVDYNNLDKREILNHCFIVFNKLVNHIINHKIQLDSLGIFLSIDLISESNVFLGKPSSLKELTEIIDTYSIPEIIVYKDINSDSIPLNEFYRVPLSYETLNANKNIKVFYKEHRVIEGIGIDDVFTRELNLSYHPVNPNA
jgi:hypothetical protein